MREFRQLAMYTKIFSSERGRAGTLNRNSLLPRLIRSIHYLVDFSIIVKIARFSVGGGGGCFFVRTDKLGLIETGIFDGLTRQTSRLWTRLMLMNDNKRSSFINH
jgi:hypothetical protein